MDLSEGKLRGDGEEVRGTKDFTKGGWTWTSLVVQWLRLQAPNVGDLDSIPGQGPRSHTQ